MTGRCSPHWMLLVASLALLLTVAAWSMPEQIMDSWFLRQYRRRLDYHDRAEEEEILYREEQWAHREIARYETVRGRKPFRVMEAEIVVDLRIPHLRGPMADS